MTYYIYFIRHSKTGAEIPVNEEEWIEFVDNDHDLTWEDKPREAKIEITLDDDSTMSSILDYNTGKISSLFGNLDDLPFELLDLADRLKTDIICNGDGEEEYIYKDGVYLGISGQGYDI